MTKIEIIATSALVLFCLAVAPVQAENAARTDAAFLDPLDTPAERARIPERQPILATAKAGSRLLGVGMRGLIIASDDAGLTWQQQVSPVQSDLTGLTFPTPLLGWAVGHDGVILHSEDGGHNWTRQLDGRSAAKHFADYYRSRITTGEQGLAPYMAEIERNFQAGPVLPYLDVYFVDADTGYAIGSFGMLATTTDGGKNWVPALERIDNPDFLNLNSFRSIGGTLYIAGEHGMVYRLDRAKGYFTRIKTGYAGSYFGLAGNESRILAYGLRGTVYCSADKGSTWTLSRTPAPVTVTDGSPASNGQIILVTQGGMAWIGTGDFDSFSSLPVEVPDAFTSITPVDAKHILLAGLGGVRIQNLK